MILEILKLNDAVLTRTFLFQTHKSSVFENCAKPTRKEMNKAPSVPNFMTSKHRDAVRVENPIAAFTS